jgi:hypothetical protein
MWFTIKIGCVSNLPFGFIKNGKRIYYANNKPFSGMSIFSPLEKTLVRILRCINYLEI